jgi:hypothetical protein
VATEAAGEGINLQVCSLMVNYDIPWNPNRLEQRLGRIHRYGQQYEVHIWNMISKDTREGQILDRLFEKLQAMRDSLGSDRVFDIIGDIIPGARLDELLKDAIFSQRRMDEIEQVIEKVDAGQTQQTLDRVFMTGLATRHIDYSGLLKESLLAEENRLVPEYVGDYFMRAFRRLGGTVEKRERHTGGLGQALSSYPSGKVFRVASVPYELRRWGQDYAFKTQYGALFREYRRITFEKAIARQHPEVEFVAPGHPLLEAVNEEILTALASSPSPNFGRGAGGEGLPAFGDPEGQRQGLLWFVQGEVTGGDGAPAGKRVFCFYQPLAGEIQKVNPAVLWDLEPLLMEELPPLSKGRAGEGIPSKLFSLLDQSASVEDFAITQALLPFRDEIAARRRREAQIKEKYGLRSLDFLIQESNGKILDYQARQAAGEDMDLPLLNEGRNLDSLQSRRSELEREIRLEGNLTVGEPRLLGAAFVVPLPVSVDESQAPEQPAFIGLRETPKEPYGAEDQEIEVGADTGVDAERRAEIEAVGMRVALEYERSQGWSPQDVSGENHGFDIRSTLYDSNGSFMDIRYIEVKARAQSGAIRLSANEWKKARHFEEKFWLYVVTNASTNNPNLTRIIYPSNRFQPDKDIFATGFIIPEDKWIHVEKDTVYLTLVSAKTS